MALSDQDRVLEKSTTTGTGTYTLAGTPGITGFNTNDYQLFSAVGNGNTCRYLAIGVDPATGIPNNTGWEFGLGTYTASGTTLARTAIYSSSNGGSAMSWTTGTRFIWVTPGAEGTVVARLPGGTVGSTEVQVLHDGSNGYIFSLLNSLVLHSPSSDTDLVRIGYGNLAHEIVTQDNNGIKVSRSFGFLCVRTGCVFGFGGTANFDTNGDLDIGIASPAAGVMTLITANDPFGGGNTLGGKLKVGIGSTATVGAVPCIVFDHFADVGNVGTGEDDLYTDTLGASTFGANGDKVIAEYDLTLASSATATRQLKIYVAGTLVGASGALTVTSGGTIQAFVSVIRVSSSVLRVTTEIVPSGLTIQPVVTYTEITGLTLSNSQIIKITGEAAGTGAATNDLIAKMGYGWYLPNA